MQSIASQVSSAAADQTSGTLPVSARQPVLVPPAHVQRFI